MLHHDYYITMKHKNYTTTTILHVIYLYIQNIDKQLYVKMNSFNLF